MNKEQLSIEEILRPIPDDRFNELTRNDLVSLLKGEQKLRQFFQKKAEEEEARAKELQEEIIYIEGKYYRIKNKFFGKSSEKSPVQPGPIPPKPPKKKRGKSTKLPSDRFPNAPIVEKRIDFKDPPQCRCCGEYMSDSGMTEESEYISTIPKQYIIVRQLRAKYRCGVCHGDIQTAPNLPRIVPSSTYSDDMIIDVALSKYCDLIPIERYVQIAGRLGIMGLPPHSLIELTHKLALFLNGAYKKLLLEIKSLKIVHADETTHKMLEGSHTSNWFLWSFSGQGSCYFECHSTRAGDVASEILKDSACEVLLTDVYCGYVKAVRVVNELRKENMIPLIRMAFCNAHARRKFKDLETSNPNDVKFYIDSYKQIYKLEKMEGTSLSERRMKMRPLFEGMKVQAEGDKDGNSSKSDLYGACNYFLNNYEGLTLFLDNEDIPIDNNPAERSLRSPVVGRKTWFGTHSVRGASTFAIIFSLVESCKLNKINPREYFNKLVSDLHQGKDAYTPLQYLNSILSPDIVNTH